MPGKPDVVEVTTIGFDDMMMDLYRMGYLEEDRGKRLKRRNRFINGLQKLICANPSVLDRLQVAPSFVEKLIPLSPAYSLCDMRHETTPGQGVEMHTFPKFIALIKSGRSQTITN